MKIKKTKRAIYFPIIIEPPFGNGAIINLKYSQKRKRCINPTCDKVTSLRVFLDLRNLSEKIIEYAKYYPICPKCLYKNIMTLIKYG